jgi:hypothetical protein
MKPHGLGRGLAFALFAALGTLPWQLLFAPFVGYASAFAVYMLGLSVAALLFLAPSLRRALGAAAVATLVLLPIALLAPAPSVALLAGLCMLGVGRSGMSYPRPFARALAVELSLGLCASLAALFFYDLGLFGSALAVWSFWLVQSTFSLLPGRSLAAEAPAGDAFDQARAAAERLMHAR